MNKTTKTKTMDSSVKLVELATLAVLIGLLGGTLFTVWDTIFHSVGLMAIDVMIAFGLAAVPGVVVMVLLAGVLRWLLVVSGYRPSRAQWFGLLIGTMVIALILAMLVLAGVSLSMRHRWLLLLAAIPVSCFSFFFVSGFSNFDRRGCPHVFVLSVVLGLVFFTCGSALLRDLDMNWIAFLIPAVLSLSVFFVGIRYIRGRPLRTAIILSLIVAVIMSVLTVFSKSGHLQFSKVYTEKPNVVLIVLDTTRRDYLGPYGNTDGLTPVLDSIAAEGVVYEDAFSTSHWTVPSHASLFTGLQPISHGCSREHRLWLDDDFVTMAEELRERGYDNAALVSNAWLFQTNLLQGFDTKIKVLGRYRRLAFHRLCTTLGLPTHWIDKGAAVVCRELKKWLSRDDRQESPVFLFVNLLEAHARYLPPFADRRAMLPDDIGYFEATSFAQVSSTRLYTLVRHSDNREQRIVEALYKAGIRYQDRRLGELLAILGEGIDLDNTLLIITADHGENIDDDGRWDHEFAVNESLIHVPLVIRYPKRFNPGTRVKGLCDLTDILPTTLSIVDGKSSRQTTEKRNLIPADFTPRSEVFTQMYPLYGDLLQVINSGYAARESVLEKFHSNWRVIRTDEWKYISSSDGTQRLYNLAADPSESVNLVDRNPEVTRDLHRRLEAWQKSQAKYIPKSQPQVKQPDNETLRQLRSLGYIK